MTNTTPKNANVIKKLPKVHYQYQKSGKEFYKLGDRVSKQKKLLQELKRQTKSIRSDFDAMMMEKLMSFEWTIQKMQAESEAESAQILADERAKMLETPLDTPLTSILEDETMLEAALGKENVKPQIKSLMAGQLPTMEPEEEAPEEEAPEEEAPEEEAPEKEAPEEEAPEEETPEKETPEEETEKEAPEEEAPEEETLKASGSSSSSFFTWVASSIIGTPEKSTV